MDEKVLKILYNLNEWWKRNKVDEAMLFEMKRDLFDELKQVMDNDSVLSIVGARWTGKTTLMYQMMDHLLKSGVESKKILFFTLGNRYLLTAGIDTIIEGYFENILKEQIRDVDMVYIFIDEIQYHKDWPSVLKQYPDLRYPIKFIISGSSSVKIKKGQSPLLGRIYQKELFPMDFREYLRFSKKQRILDLVGGNIMGIFSGPEKLEEIHNDILLYKSEINILLGEYLLKGGYIEVLKNDNLQIWQNKLQDVIKRTIYEDIAAAYADEVRTPRKIEDLFTFIASNTSQTFSYHSISKNLDMHVETVIKYVEYLRSAYMMEELVLFSRSAAKQKRANKKYLLLDTGLRNAIFRENEETLHESSTFGLVVESAVRSNIISNYRIYNAYYWKNGGEVDLVVDMKKKLLPIEVKYKNEISKKDTRGLIEFMNKFSIDVGIVVTKDKFEYKYYNDKMIIFIPAYLFLLLLK